MKARENVTRYHPRNIVISKITAYALYFWKQKNTESSIRLQSYSFDALKIETKTSITWYFSITFNVHAGEEYCYVWKFPFEFSTPVWMRTFYLCILYSLFSVAISHAYRVITQNDIGLCLVRTESCFYNTLAFFTVIERVNVTRKTSSFLRRAHFTYQLLLRFSSKYRRDILVPCT